MNAILWIAVAFSAVGWVVFVLGWLAGKRATTGDDYGVVVVAFVGLFIFQGLALIIAVIGFIVRALA